MRTAPAAISDVIHAAPTDNRVPFKDGFLLGDLARPADLRLAGSRCAECGVALLGVRRRCENCSSVKVEVESFATTGTVYTYTVQRHAPPKPHCLPEPWVPRPIAWVDLDDNGPRILAPVDCPADAVCIGMKVKLVCGVAFTDEQERAVVAYKFIPDAQR